MCVVAQVCAAAPFPSFDAPQYATAPDAIDVTSVKTKTCQNGCFLSLSMVYLQEAILSRHLPLWLLVIVDFADFLQNGLDVGHLEFG